MAENVLLKKTSSHSKPSRKIMHDKASDIPEQAAIEKLRTAFRSMRFLTKKEQIAINNKLAEIEKKEGLLGVQDYVMKELGLN